MADKKYLDSNGLLYFWQKIKAKLETKIGMQEVIDKGYQTSSQVEAAITSKGYQDANQVNAAITGKGYQTASQVETAITKKGYQTSSEVETAITNKGYQTANQVNAAITGAISNIVGVKHEKYDQLPTQGAVGTIYLVPKAGTDNNADIYEEYIWFDGKFEYIGSSNAITIDEITNEEIDDILKK